MQILDLAVGITVLVLQLVLIGILLRRKLQRRFPFFFAYTLYSVLAAIVLAVVILKFPVLYYQVYWTTEFIYGLLGLLAIMEVFESVLALFGFEGSGWRFILPIGAMVIIGISLWRAFFHPMGHGPLVRFAAGAVAFEVGVRCLQAGILLLCLAPRKMYGVLWEYDFSIVGGLGLAAFITLVADVMRLKFGTILETLFQYAPPAAFFGAASYWIFVFARPEPPRPTLKISRKERVALLELWIKAMKAVRKRREMRYSARLSGIKRAYPKVTRSDSVFGTISKQERK